MPTLLAAALMLLAAPATPAPMPPAPPCDVAVLADVAGAAAAADDDVARARAACRAARAAFADLFGEPVPPVRVLLRAQAGYRTGVQGGRAVVFWPTGAVLAAHARDRPGAATHVAGQWRDVLPHEIAHALLAVRFFDDDDAPGDGYGTPFPDWLDEAVAIWAESPPHRAARVSQALALGPEWLELEAILAGPHPAAGNARVLSVRDGAPVPRDEALWNFYPRAVAVLTFVHEAGGTAATTELARRLVANPADRRALAGLPGLPGEWAGVVAAWQAWVAAGRGAGD
jgi:hypothetical protein